MSGAATRESAMAVAARFMAARRARQPIAEPDVPAPAGAAEAYALQDAHRDALLRASGGRIIGHKVGATNAGAQQHLGLPGPFFAPLLSAFVHAAPARLDGAALFHRLIEVEIAFRIGADIRLPDPDAPLARPALVEAIATAMPAIEVADSRYAAWQRASGTAAIADLGFAGHWVHGPERSDWRGLDLLGMATTLTAAGVEVRRGTGSAVLGDPLAAIEHLLRHLAGRGEGLRAGDLVTTGSTTAIFAAPPRSTLVARFDHLADVTVDLA